MSKSILIYYSRIYLIMEFLTFIAVCILIYLVYLIRQDFKDHSVRIESQMQRVTEVVIKSQDKDE